MLNVHFRAFWPATQNQNTQNEKINDGIIIKKGTVIFPLQNYEMPLKYK